MQDFIGLAYLLESLFGAGILVDIRMEFSGQPPVDPFYFILAGIFFTSEGGIIVFELHAFTFLCRRVRHRIMALRNIIRGPFDSNADCGKLYLIMVKTRKKI
jgi:hypothetical protein